VIKDNLEDLTAVTDQREHLVGGDGYLDSKNILSSSIVSLHEGDHSEGAFTIFFLIDIPSLALE
jgi:hypothetical protein